MNVRWDVLVGDIDKKSLAELAAVPTTSDRLYPLILCAQRYIKSCCQRLNGGNMIVKRTLMCGDQRYLGDGI